MSDLITNAELRIEAERLCDENDDLRDELKGAQEENAKLRELVLDFYLFVSHRAAKPWLAVRRDRMRELGIEV